MTYGFTLLDPMLLIGETLLYNIHLTAFSTLLDISILVEEPMNYCTFFSVHYAISPSSCCCPHNSMYFNPLTTCFLMANNDWTG
jgi:hypothetical protein